MAQPESRSYTTSGSEEFHQRIDEILRRLTNEIRGCIGRNLVALVLGGGYGRGEGGVVSVDGTEQLYNDLDFILVAQNPKKVPARELVEIRHRYTGELNGIHVDFSRPQTVQGIRKWPHYMMWQDILLGHVVLYGPPNILQANAPEYLRQPLPQTEALRLMLNRGAGLLWALLIDERTVAPEDADFIRRNYHKCAQALGDSCLISFGRYQTQYAGRERILEDLRSKHAELDRLNIHQLYENALHFRTCPDLVSSRQPSREDMFELASHWAATLLFIERRRTGRSWPSSRAYAAWAGIREHEMNRPSCWPKNIARNLRLGRLSLRHPRERLYREMSELLETAAMRGLNPKHSKRILDVWTKYN